MQLACDINPLPRVATRLGLGLGDQGRDKGFSVATGHSRHWVTTVGGVATGFGQGREALCRDMETKL